MLLQDLPTASLIKRLAALVYDSLLMMALAMAYGGVYLAIKHALLGIELGPDERATMSAPGFVGLLLLLEMFYWFFWCRGGQTLGMRAWRLKVIQTNGDSPNLLQAMVRGMTAPISFFCAGLGFLWCLWDRDGATWHDKLSHTRVVVLPKQK